VSRFPTLELERFPSRALLMAIAASTALAVDFVTKELAVALDPSTLLFNVSDRTPFGLGGTLILVAAATSLLACVVPARIVAVGAGVALGGGLGNLTSRYWWDARGGSPDFIPFGDGSTGNVADLFIGVGLGAMLIGTVAWLGWTIARRA
jgi:Signal peptidase (SPase) II